MCMVMLVGEPSQPQPVEAAQPGKGWAAKLKAGYSVRRNLRSLFVPSSSRFAQVDGVRGLSILAVLTLHGVLYLARSMPAPQYDELMASFAGRLFLQGDLGVDAFFVISGLLVAHFLMKERVSTGRFSVGEFYLRRALRLMPAYLVTLGLVCLIEKTNVDMVWSNLLYVNNFVPVARMTMRWAWSLAIEEQFYWIFPLFLLGFYRLKQGRGALLLGLMVLALAIRAFVASRTEITLPLNYVGAPAKVFEFFEALYMKPHTRYGALLCGVGVAYLMHHVPVSRQWAARPVIRGVLTVLALAGIAFAFMVPRLATPSTMPSEPTLGLVLNRVYLVTYHYTFAFGVAALLWVMMSSDALGGLSKLLSSRVLFTAGQLAYSSYLLNPIVAKLVYKAWPVPIEGLLGVSLAFFAGVVATLLAAMTLYLFIERPFMALRGAAHAAPVTAQLPATSESPLAARVS